LTNERRRVNGGGGRKTLRNKMERRKGKKHIVEGRKGEERYWGKIYNGIVGKNVVEKSRTAK